MRMSDGETWVAGKDYKDSPQALQIECAAADQSTVERYFKKTYSLTSSRFPLHVRM